MTVNEYDDIVIGKIIDVWSSSKVMNSLGLITDYQYKMIRKWLFTSTKKAERRKDE